MPASAVIEDLDEVEDLAAQRDLLWPGAAIGSFFRVAKKLSAT